MTYILIGILSIGLIHLYMKCWKLNNLLKDASREFVELERKFLKANQAMVDMNNLFSDTIQRIGGLNDSLRIVVDKVNNLEKKL
jgi:hypothetical protein